MGHHHVTSVSREVTRPALAKPATVFPDSSESRGTDSPAALHLHQLHPLLGKLSLHGSLPAAQPSLPFPGQQGPSRLAGFPGPAGGGPATCLEPASLSSLWLQILPFDGSFS